ncbi:MAG TPA: hypothetical protein VM840_03515 [Actinomycetota bacterium]|nr:hypothetical protein [Actinomycetota bacterium]
MRETLNQHSYAFVVVSVLVVSLVMLRRFGGGLRLLGLISVIAALAVGWLVLRPGSGDVRAPEDLDRALADGRPVMLELYSNY